MLDVARTSHRERVEQYIDILALYKLTCSTCISPMIRAADSHQFTPELAAIGIPDQVGGAWRLLHAAGLPGNHPLRAGPTSRLSRDRHARTHERRLTAYPEWHAAHAVGALMRNDVGWSTLCVDKEETYALWTDVVRRDQRVNAGCLFPMGETRSKHSQSLNT